MIESGQQINRENSLPHTFQTPPALQPQEIPSPGEPHVNQPFPCPFFPPWQLSRISPNGVRVQSIRNAVRTYSTLVAACCCRNPTELSSQLHDRSSRPRRSRFARNWIPLVGRLQVCARTGRRPVMTAVWVFRKSSALWTLVWGNVAPVSNSPTVAPRIVRSIAPSFAVLACLLLVLPCTAQRLSPRSLSTFLTLPPPSLERSMLLGFFLSPSRLRFGR